MKRKIFLSARLAMIFAISKQAILSDKYNEGKKIIQDLYLFEHEFYKNRKVQYGNTTNSIRKDIVKDIVKLLADEKFKNEYSKFYGESIHTKHHIFPLMRKSMGISVFDNRLDMSYCSGNLDILKCFDIKLFNKNRFGKIIKGLNSEKNIISLDDTRHHKGLNKYFYEGSLLLPHQLLLVLLDQNSSEKTKTIMKETGYIQNLQKKIIQSPITDLYDSDVYSIG